MEKGAGNCQIVSITEIKSALKATALLDLQELRDSWRKKRVTALTSAPINPIPVEGGASALDLNEVPDRGTVVAVQLGLAGGRLEILSPVGVLLPVTVGAPPLTLIGMAVLGPSPEHKEEQVTERVKGRFTGYDREVASPAQDDGVESID